MAGTIASMAKTPMTRRSFHCPDDLWRDAMEAAEQVGDNLPDVLRKALETYVRKNRSREDNR